MRSILSVDFLDEWFKLTPGSCTCRATCTGFSPVCCGFGQAFRWPVGWNWDSVTILRASKPSVSSQWSREAVLSRHTSTALSMAAAFASASAPGIFPSESEGGRHFHWVKKERKENGVTGYSPVILFSHTFLALVVIVSSSNP